MSRVLEYQIKMSLFLEEDETIRRNDESSSSLREMSHHHQFREMMSHDLH